MNDPEKQQLLDELEELRSEFRSTLPKQRVTVETCWHALNEKGADHAALDALTRLLQQLSGSGASHGYEEISIHAERALEQITPYLSRKLPPNTVLLGSLRPHLDGLRDALSNISVSAMKLVK